MSEKASSVSMPNPARNVSLAMAAALILLIAIGCERSPSGPSQVIRVNGLTITVTGEFRTAGSEVGIKFSDAQGNLMEVGRVTLSLIMYMSGKPMIASVEGERQERQLHCQGKARNGWHMDGDAAL